MRKFLAVLAIALPAPGAAQFMPPPIAPVAPAPDGDFVEIPPLQVDLVMKAGSDRIYFAGQEYGLNVASRATLAAQARWLLANPMVRAVIEGHSDQRDTRDHALAVGERRAIAVRDFLVSQGVPPFRLVVTSWGKERPIQPAPGDVGRDRNARVVTTIIR